ncbi:MAG: putative dsRNA-binding protein, partial [Eubacterium sp.]
ILQEVVQQNPDQSINYAFVGSSGPDHNKVFEAEVRLNSNVIGRGKGKSKKSAEQAAAREALKLMGLSE